MQTGIGVRIRELALHVVLIATMQTDHIVCLIVAQTLISWWHTSSVPELLQTVFSPLYVSERGPSEPQDGDGNGMKLRFGRRASQNMPKETERV